LTGLIEDIPLFGAEEKVALLDAGREGFAGITLGHPKAFTLPLQRFQSAIHLFNRTRKFQAFKNPSLFRTANRTHYTDDTIKRDYRDRDRINVHEEYERRYWTKELGVTPDELKRTVERVGVMVADVRKALGK
jgi:hypothetical protein